MKNRVIWKFPVGIGPVTTIKAPRSGRVVLAGLDPADGGPAIWVELDPEAPPEERHFVIYPTGKEIDGDGGYPFDIHVGSLIDRTFVWHIYEKRA
jgi:hypothetical protein